MAGASSAPSSSSSSKAGRQSSITSYFARAEPMGSSRTSTPVHLPPVRPAPVASGSGSGRKGSTSDDASNATKAKSGSPGTPSAARKDAVANGTGNNSPIKSTPRKSSPLKQSTSARSLSASPRKVSFTEGTAKAPAGLSSDSSSELEVTVSPRMARSPIKRDVKGKGKAPISLSTTEDDENDDDDDVVEDSQDPFALPYTNGPLFGVKASPKIPAVASERFYSPSSNKAASPKLASPSKVRSSPTKGAETPRAGSATPVVGVSSPASTSSRRSSRPAAAAAAKAITKSWTSPFGRDMQEHAAASSSTRARQSTPKLAARTPRAASVAAQSTTRLTKEALASLSPDSSTPPRTPRRNTASSSGRYLRDPSGSPLSSLGPTPKKLTSRTTIKKPVAKPNFWLDIPSMTKRKPVMRRERSLTAPHLDPEASDEDGMDLDRDDAATEKGSSPNKRKQDDVDGALADSSSSSDSADESEDDSLALALARAKDRRAGGTSILPTSDTGHHPSSSTAALPTSPDIRRSSRAAAKDEEKAKQQEQEKRAKEKAKMKMDMGLMDLDAGAKGRLGIAALQRERLEREKSGRNADWLEGRRLIAEGGGDEYDSDGSSTTEDKGVTLDSIKLEDLVSAAANVVGDPDEEYAAFAGSPQKREAKQEALRRANDIATTLKDDVGRATRETSGEVEDRQARCFWREEHNVVAWEAETGQGEWSKKIEKAIADGRKDSKRFPPSVTLFSRLNGEGSLEERTDISKRLLSLICHPLTSSDLAGRANALLDRLIMHTSRSCPFSSPFSAADIHVELEALGARTELLTLPEQVVAMNDSDDDDEGVARELGLSTPGKDKKAVKETKRPISAEERKEAVIRLLSVVQGVAGSKPALFNADDIVSLVVVCSRLALDPTAAPIRSAIERTLESLVNPIPLSDTNTISKLYNALISVHHQTKPQHQLELLRALPQSSKTSKVLRRWLAWGFLTDPTSAVAVVATSDVFDAPPSLESLQALLENPGDGPFRIDPEMDDAALYSHALTLTIALTDLTDDLYAGEVKGKQAKQAVEQIAQALAMVEGRIRSNIRTSDPMRNRAKNALTRLSHALTYQARTANGKTSGFDFSAEDQAFGGGSGAARGKPRARVDGGGGQTTLNFGPVATSPTA